MKKILLIAAAVFSTAAQGVFAQCGNDNTLISGDLTPPGVSLSTTLTYGAGQYVTAYVMGGAQYQVTTCSTSAYDTQLTVYDDATSAFYAYNDDYCGLQSTVLFTPSSCGYVRVLLDQYSCNNSGLLTPVVMTQLTAATSTPTITCANDTLIMVDSAACFATNVILNVPTLSCAYILTNNTPDTFSVGTTVVTWIASDGNTSDTCYQNVTVIDNILPTITCAADTTVSTDPSVCQASGVVLNLPMASDNCGISSITNDAPSAFSSGINTVTWTATDANGNINTCSQTVTVIDLENPVIVCPVDTMLAANANGCAGILTLIAPTVSDNCGIDSLSSNYHNGDTLSLGTYTIVYTATDFSGNTATCSYNVTVYNSLNAQDSIVDLACNNDMSGAIDITMTGGVPPLAFDWDNDGTGDYDDMEDLTGLSAGPYSLSVMDSIGCTTILNGTVNEPLPLNLSAISAPQTSGTANGTIDLTVTGGTAPYVYDWSNDGTGDNDDSEDLSGLAGGTYTVSVTDNHGCNQGTNVTVDDISGISSTQQNIFAQLYPNPSNGTFTVELSDYDNTVLEVVNAIGENIYSVRLHSSKTTVALNESNGVFMIHIKRNSTYLFARRMVISK